LEKVIALIDGEHYVPVVAAGIEQLRRSFDVKAAVFLGGTEKVLDEQAYDVGVPVIFDADPLRALERAIDEYGADRVFDLSDEPVVTYDDRMRLASHALAKGAAYSGPDFDFRPPSTDKAVGKPSVSIIGTGKRVGKTAVSAYIARELKAKGLNPCVVAMGRGGPASPELIRGEEVSLGPSELLEFVRQGKHAASDNVEDAVMARVTTVGCRRCGGGMAGEPFISNVREGAELADRLDAGILVFEGSGAALPPVKTDATILVAGAGQPVGHVAGFFGTYRLLLADLICLTMCEEPVASEEQIERMTASIGSVRPDLPILATVFRPRPIEPLECETVFFASTAPPAVLPRLSEYLEEETGCRVVAASSNLSNRPMLRDDIAAAPDFDCLLTELKAASVDVATQVASEMGKRVVYCDNDPVVLGEDPDALRGAAVALARRIAADKKE